MSSFAYNASGYFCPRLVDYFLIVGPPENLSYSDSQQKSEILKQYPPIDYEDFVLPPETVFFCQPDAIETYSDSRVVASVFFIHCSQTFI